MNTFWFCNGTLFDPTYLCYISFQKHCVLYASLIFQGWSSAYTLESLILQISATLVQGKARITFSAPSKNQYTFAKARQSFKHLVQMHEKHGKGNSESNCLYWS